MSEKGGRRRNEKAVRDYAVGFQALESLVDGFVVNVSTPKTPGLVGLLSEDFLEKLAGEVSGGKPVFVKFSPDLTNAELRTLAGVIRSNDRFAGIVLTNTSRALAEKLVKAPVGGLSGEPLFERALECVTLAREALGAEKILIGVGGVMGPLEAKKMRAAGADLIEVYTGFVYGGPSWVRELSRIPELS